MSAAIGLGCAAGFVMLEAAVRLLLPYNSPETVRRHSVQYIPKVYSRHLLEPNQRIDTRGAWGERPGDGPGLHIEINERGYRGGPIALPKPAGVRRVVILGGSSVFDINATEGRDWPHLVEERLRFGGHRTVDVINAGVPGHASSDSLGRLYSQIWMYRPDFVLIDHVWNDMKYMGRAGPDRSLIDLIEPYDPSADPFQTYRGPLDHLLSYSQVYVKLRTRYFLWKVRPGTEGAVAGGPDAAIGPVGLEQFRLNLKLLVDASRDIGAIPVLMTEPTLVAPSNTAADRDRIHYEYQGMDHEALVRGFDACYRIIREVGNDKQVPVLDLASVLNGRGDLFEDQVHTNPRGSEAIAGLVADFLAKTMDLGAP
jgi:lysophospholipase L1-like esterase